MSGAGGKPVPTSKPADWEEWEETEDVELRKHLGLRPIAYAQDPGKSLNHPDPAPCPPWCWIVADNPDDYAHDVDHDHPLVATHDLSPAPTLAATLYRGTSLLTEDRMSRVVQAATVVVGATQHGTRKPTVQVHLRHYPTSSDDRGRREERLRLTVEDARELITALGYVCDQVEGVEP